MTSVFISYVIEDQLAAALVSQALTGEGHIVCRDNRLPTTVTSRDELERQLGEAGVIVVLRSPHAARSDRVHDEAAFAVAHDKLVAAHVQACEIPPTLCVMEPVNLETWNGDAAAVQFRELAHAIVACARA